MNQFGEPARGCLLEKRIGVRLTTLSEAVVDTLGDIPRVIRVFLRFG